MVAAGSESSAIGGCIRAIAAALGRQPRFVCDSGALPKHVGSYFLAISLVDALPLSGRFEGRRLEPGDYLYCGSAQGSGGVRARGTRHMRSDKVQRWHVDQLTCVATGMQVAGFRDRDECDLVRALAAGGGFRFPLPGFGSSDCRSCTSHLLKYAA